MFFRALPRLLDLRCVASISQECPLPRVYLLSLKEAISSKSLVVVEFSAAVVFFFS